jgi:glycosyltransferase involved in cell wall biosynthesis
MDARIASTDADGAGRALAVAHGAFIDWRGVPAILFPRWPGEALKFSPRLRSWLDANARNFDVLHLHAFFSHSVVAGARAAVRSGRPYLLRPLGTLSRYGMSRHSARKRVFLAMWGSAVLDGAAGVHCTSEAERVEVEDLGVSRCFVAPLGVHARDDATHREPLLVFVGRLDPKKNVESLIRAFHVVASQNRGWRLVIAGAGEPAYESELHNLAASGDGAGGVEFTGWLDEGARDELLGRASLFVLASRYENFGIAVAEAMGAGVPVIVSEGVDLARDVRAAGAGWTCGSDDRSLAAVLAEAIGAEGERRTRGEAARALARERFGWARCVSLLNAEYERCLSRRAA